MKTQACPDQFKMTDESDGSFEGYGAIFNTVDQGQDIIDPTAFDVSLDRRKSETFPILWQHDPSQPIGFWESIAPDAKGLFCKGRILRDVTKGSDAIALLKAMAIGGLSIGYKTIQAVEEGGGRIRRLMEVDLREISVVTFPMHPDAGVTAIKSNLTIRQFENTLRDAGFSQNEAKAIAARGFSGLTGHRDDGSEKADSSAAMREAVLKLKHLSEEMTNG
jgi:uncharacterized protein